MRATIITLLVLLGTCCAFAGGPYGGMYPIALTNAGLPDPLQVTTITATGVLTGAAVTDGTLSVTGGEVTGAGNVTCSAVNASGTVTAGVITDGTLSAASGSVTGAINITASGVITGSALEVSEGVVYTGHQTISAATDTLTGTDHIVQVDASGNSVNITLPAVAASDGKIFVFEVETDPGVNTITLTGNAAELIDGANTYTSLDTQYQAVYLYCTGTDWRVVAEAGMGSSDPLYVDHIASADTTECPILGEGAGANLNAGAEGNFIAGNQAAGAPADAGFDNNIVIGCNAMGAVGGAARNNIAFGREALCGSAATTGDHCLAAGYRSLYSHTTGNSVIGLGKWSGYLNTTQSNALYLGGWNSAAQSPLDHRWEVTTLTADHHIDDFQVNRVTTYEAPLVCDIDGLVVDRLQVESAAGITLKPTAIAPGNPTTGVVIYFLTPDNDVISKDSSGNTVVIAAMP